MTFDTDAPWTGYLPLSSVIADPNQPREYFDEEGMADLKGSLQSFRQVTAATVRIPDDNTTGKGALILNDGERRLRNLIAAGKDRIWVMYDPLLKHDSSVAQIVANFCRQGHTPIETARALKQVQETMGVDLKTAATKLGIKYLWAVQMNSLNNLEPTLLALTSPPTPESQMIKLKTAFTLSKIESHSEQLEAWQKVQGTSPRMMPTVIQMMGHERRQTRGRKPSDDTALVVTAVRAVTRALKHADTLPDELFQRIGGANSETLSDELSLAEELLQQVRAKIGHRIQDEVKESKPTPIEEPPPPKLRKKRTPPPSPRPIPAPRPLPPSPDELRAPTVLAEGTPADITQFDPPQHKVTPEEEAQMRREREARLPKPAPPSVLKTIVIGHTVTSEDVLRELREKKEKQAQLRKQSPPPKKPDPEEEIWTPFKSSDFPDPKG